MEKYWALDYVDDTSCELVYQDKLYRNELEAEAARAAMPEPVRFEVSWYSKLDLREVYEDDELEVDDKLEIHSRWL